MPIPEPVHGGDGPFHPTTTELFKTHRRHNLVAYGVAFLAIAVATTFVILYVMKTSAVYEPVFEGLPAHPTEILDCPNDDQRHWAQVAGGATHQCIFSGDMTLAGGKGVTEADVIQKCNDRADCGGYTVRVVSSYEPCPTSACTLASGATPVPATSVPGCVLESYNKGQPEYMLFSTAGMADVRQVKSTVQGSNHEVRTVSYVRKTV